MFKEKTLLQSPVNSTLPGLYLGLSPLEGIISGWKGLELQRRDTTSAHFGLALLTQYQVGSRVIIQLDYLLFHGLVAA